MFGSKFNSNLLLEPIDSGSFWALIKWDIAHSCVIRIGLKLKINFIVM